MTTLSRRRSRDEEPEKDERPARRSRRDEPDEDRAERPARRRSRDEDEPDERPARKSRRSEPEDEPDERPSRRGSRGGDEPRRRSSSATGGFDNYSQKRKAGSKFADEFKPAPDTKVLIKFLEDGPFDNYDQHWIEEGDAKGKTRHSFVCRDDEPYFGDDDGCPLCDVGEPASTKSLFNVLNLSNPRKPVVQVWSTSVTVTDKIERLAQSDRTSPINKEDLYFEVEMVKSAKKTTWDIQPIKARDLLDDFGIDPFTEDELEDFSDDLFDDRKAVTQVDSYEALDDLAASLDG